MNATELLDVLVSDVLAAGPDAIAVFQHHGMACVGCPFAPFETLAEVAGNYGVDPLELASALTGAGVVVHRQKEGSHDHH